MACNTTLGRYHRMVVTVPHRVKPTLRCLAKVAVVIAGATSAIAEELPTISVNDENGKRIVIADDKLFEFEKDMRKRMAEEDGPTEIVILARSSPIEFQVLPRGGERNIGEVLVLSFFMSGGEAEWISEYGEKRRTTRLSIEQIKLVREFLAANAVDNLPPLDGSRGDWRIVGGEHYVFVHFKSNKGTRVEINNPNHAPDDPDAKNTAQKYDKVVKFFRQFTKSEKSKGE